MLLAVAFVSHRDPALLLSLLLSLLLPIEYGVSSLPFSFV